MASVAGRCREETGAAPLLRAEGVAFRYRTGQPALRDVSLTIRAGESWALIGPNGAGKSTLLRLICGRFSPDRGSITMDGREPYRDAGARARIALVPQRDALFPKLTVRENIAAFSGLAGHPVGMEVAARSLALASAEDLADRRVDGLSGGQARRANIAVAMTGGPDLLVLDEPTTGVDARSRSVLVDTIVGLHRSGTAILVVTHDLDFAEAVAHHAVLMTDGRIAHAGAIDDLIVQAFGRGAQEVRALLREDPSPDERRLLLAHGFRPIEGERAWCAILPESTEIAGLQATLVTSVRGLAELRLRAAGLAALLQRVDQPGRVAA